MQLPARLKELIEMQESLEAQRTRIVITLESEAKSVELEGEVLMFLQMTLGHQVHIAKQLLEECASITCERIEWPHEIRA